MLMDKLSKEERRLIDEAVERGEVKRPRPQPKLRQSTAMPPSEAFQRQPPPPSRKQPVELPAEMSVKSALEWAFGREYASLSFAGMAEPEYGAHGFGTEYILMQRAMLGGVRIEGGGSSDPHEFAEIIAAVVSNTVNRVVAYTIAECARAGRTPDWMEGAEVRCVPRAWHTNPHGSRAKTEVLRTIVTKQKRRKVRRDIIWCPVTYVPTQQQIDSARQAYIRWWHGLNSVRRALHEYHGPFKINEKMPHRTPWLDRK